VQLHTCAAVNPTHVSASLPRNRVLKLWKLRAQQGAWLGSFGTTTTREEAGGAGFCGGAAHHPGPVHSRCTVSGGAGS
jgi:hypothetical protein